MKTQTKDSISNKKEETTSLPTTTSQASTSVEALGEILVDENVEEVAVEGEAPETPEEDILEITEEDLVEFTFFCNVIDGKLAYDAKERVLLSRTVAEKYRRNNRGEF